MLFLFIFSLVLPCPLLAFPVREEETRTEVVSSSSSMEIAAAELMEAAAKEPQQCVKRLVCDLATGQMGGEKGTELLNAIRDVQHSMPGKHVNLMGAMANGHRMGSVRRCELRYGCPFSGEQLREIAGQI